MLLDEVVFCESSSHMSAHTVHCLTFLHVNIDMNATLGVVQYTTYPTIHSGHDYSLYTSLETIEQNLRNPIYLVLIILCHSKMASGMVCKDFSIPQGTVIHRLATNRRRRTRRLYCCDQWRESS